MDPRFIAVVERSMAADGRFWCLIVYDEVGRPVGTAGLSLCWLDLVLLGQPRLKRIAESVRRLLPKFLKLPVLFCGLPVSAGQSHLCLAPESDSRQVLALVDEALRRLARRHGAKLIVFKEFAPKDRGRLDDLLTLGYELGDSFPMNHFPSRFGSFAEFCASLRSHYRYKIRRSQRKFHEAGFRVEHLSGEAALARYTDDVHRLYESVVDRAEVRLECLPRSFFEQLVRHFPAEVRFLAVVKEGRIVGFSWGLLTGGTYQSLFIGLDYGCSAAGDLYFNLMTEDLAYALDQGVADVQVGQTADVFKSRLACAAEPRYVYVKGTGRVMRWLVRKTARWFFPPPAPPPQRDLFRDPPEPSPHEAACCEGPPAASAGEQKRPGQKAPA
jgi:hypothetical protein